MKQTRLNEYVCDSLVDFGIIDVDDSLDIHKKSMNENNKK